MAKVELLPGQDICRGCQYYIDKDDWSSKYICSNGDMALKVSECECMGFNPDEYANSHWKISHNPKTPVRIRCPRLARWSNGNEYRPRRES